MVRDVTGMAQIRAWGIAILWSAILWGAGGDALSATSTSRFLGPLLEWIFPTLSGADKDLLLGLTRKSAHIVEYAVFAALLLRALLLSWTRSFARAALLTLAAAFALAVADEWRQGLSAVRTGSEVDVALDSAGALAAVLLWGFFGRAGRRNHRSAAPTDRHGL